MKKELWIHSVNISVLPADDQVAYLMELAVERFNRNQSFTDEEVSALFEALEKGCKAKPLAEGLRTLIKHIQKRYNGKISFNVAVVEACVSCLRAGGAPDNFLNI